LVIFLGTATASNIIAMLDCWLFRAVSRSTLILLLGTLVVIATSAAQSPPPSSESQSAQTSGESEASVAAAVRNSKTQKTPRAKKVFTDEDMEVTAGPLPRLKMDGAENADDVVTAIAKYKETHSAQQTEEAVHIWYDRYDEMLAAAIRANIDMKAIREANVTNGYELCQQSQDYQQCENRRMAEMRGARSDQAEATKNTNLEVRIQHAFMKVRNGLARNNLRYEWFKVRTTNGIDVF
jgi:hypothetical protein